MKNRFYLACLRDNVGQNMAFHAKNGGGYVTDVAKAECYSREQAQQRWNGARSFDLPISADHVDALTVWKTDCQRLPVTSDLSPDDTGYLAFRAGSWDGNDVYWQTIDGLSLDVTQATVLSIHEARELSERYVAVPYQRAQSVKRQTFAYALLNPRTMIQGAGLRTPAHIANQKRRKDSPLLRMNCPGCGQLHWQTQAYQFEGCRDVNCKSHDMDF